MVTVILWVMHTRNHLEMEFPMNIKVNKNQTFNTRFLTNLEISYFAKSQSNLFLQKEPSLK